jgi:ParB-like chromosome segregation protein Spo0J
MPTTTYHPGTEKGYALDFLSVVRYVATRLDRAAPAALSAEHLAANYRHSVPSDYSRVELHHGVSGKRAISLFLIERAIAALGKQVKQTDEGYRLTKSFDKLRYEGQRLYYDDINDNSRFGNPFDPMKGGWAKNTRKFTDTDLAELQWSMEQFGWLPGHPAVMDERGVVLVGHRRLAVAEKLGIEPHVIQLRLGSGDDGDVQRWRIAIGSNLGNKPLTPTDRKALAAALYETGEWSQDDIAKALHVHQTTVARDLSEDMQTHNPRSQRVSDPQTLNDREQAVLAVIEEAPEPPTYPELYEALPEMSEPVVRTAVRDLERKGKVQEAPTKRKGKTASGKPTSLTAYAAANNAPVERPATMPCPHCHGSGRVPV